MISVRGELANHTSAPVDPAERQQQELHAAHAAPWRQPPPAHRPASLCQAAGMTDVIFREAVRADLPAIIALLADDVLGKARDFTEVDEAYERAFADITADPRNHLIVADDDGELVGCMQITYIPGLGRHGAERSLIESVRVRSDRRGRGLGREMMTWAIDQARRARLRAGAAHHRQDPRRRAPLLPRPRLRGQPRGHEAGALTRADGVTRARPSGMAAPGPGPEPARARLRRSPLRALRTAPATGSPPAQTDPPLGIRRSARPAREQPRKRGPPCAPRHRPAPSATPGRAARPAWAVRVAHLVPLVTLPSGLWRIALVAGVPLGAARARHAFRPNGCEIVYIVSLGLVAACARPARARSRHRPWGEASSAGCPASAAGLGARRRSRVAWRPPPAPCAVTLICDRGLGDPRPPTTSASPRPGFALLVASSPRWLLSALLLSVTAAGPPPAAAHRLDHRARPAAVAPGPPGRRRDAPPASRSGGQRSQPRRDGRASGGRQRHRRVSRRPGGRRAGSRTRSARSIRAGSWVATRAVMPRACTTARSRSMMDRPVSESS